MKRTVLSWISAVILCLTAVPALAAENSRLVDDADILSQYQEETILEKLDTLSDTYNADFVIVTVETTGRKSIDDYAEDYYAEMGFGQGEENSGLMLLLDMGERAYWIYPYGGCCDTFSESTCEDIGSQIEPYLREDEYPEAFDAFTEACEKQYQFPLGQNLIICLVIGLVIALIVTGVMRSQLKTVRKQHTANQYTKPGSMRITHSTDLFLYRNVTRTRRVQSSSGGSGGRSSNRGAGGRF